MLDRPLPPSEPAATGAAPPSSSHGPDVRRKARRRWWGRAIGLAAVALSAWLIHRTLAGYSLADLRAAMAAVPATRLGGCIAFTALSYLTLTFFDFLALRSIGRRLPWRSAAFASFTSLSLGHTIGFAGLSSGAIRYRLYARWGLSVEDVAKLVLFCGITVGVGLMALGGVAMLLRPDLSERIAGLGGGWAVTVGLACLAGPLLYVVLSALVRRPLRIRSWSIALPTWRIAALQVLAGTVNFAFVAAALYQALKAVADVTYGSVAAVYVIANTATMITHVPGGLGVIENVVTSFVPGRSVIGALLVFRCVYFFAPLLIGAALLAISELARGRIAAPPAQRTRAAAG